MSISLLRPASAMFFCKKNKCFLCFYLFLSCATQSYSDALRTQTSSLHALAIFFILTNLSGQLKEEMRLNSHIQSGSVFSHIIIRSRSMRPVIILYLFFGKRQRQTDRQRQIDRQTDRQTNRDRKTQRDRQTDRLTDRQTDTEKWPTLPCMII